VLIMAVPRLERMQKEEGEAGRQKINQWTRLATVPLAVLQAYSFIALLRGQSGAISDSLSAIPMGLAIAVVSAGTMLLMWLGELISERKLGNGISLIIFAGIVASLPRAVQQTISVYDPSQLFDIILFLVVALVTIVGVVYVTEAQRNIPVSYARSIRGAGGYGGNSTYLPLRVNMAGVIPIIFAVSLVLFPPTLAKFLQQASSPWLRHAAESVISLFANQAFYAALYGLLVFGFTYFYTYVVFQPKQVSENLQKQGGFIPGIRPGPHTADYLQYVTNRILLAGAAFLAAIAVLPTILRSSGGVSGSLVVGGTSVLIVVSVVIETIRQIQSQLVMRDYEKL
jgi:preprotein translocase subunit SecY